MLPRLRVITFLLACPLLAAPAAAGGLWVWEVGNALDVGNASASWGAGADDASTALTNPAAMTLLERSELGLQLSPGIYRYRFDTDAANTTTGGSGSKNSFVPLLGSSGVWAVRDDLRVGVGIGGLMGGTLDYGDDWAGRYVVSKVALNVLGAAPGVAWQATDWLSLGASAVVAHGALEQETRVNNVLPGQRDGKLEIEDSDLAFGGTFGMLVQPCEGVRLALTYRTPVDFELRDRLDFSGLLPPLADAVAVTGLDGARIKVDMDVPQQVLLGIYVELRDDLALMANFDWEDWSQFQAIELTLASETAQRASVDIPFDDTWHAALGVRWNPMPRWLLSAGVGYDSSMVSRHERSPVLPVDRQIRYGAGVQYEWSEDLLLGLSYLYMDGGSAPLTAGGGTLTGTLSGDYDRNELHVFTISLNWRL